MKAAHIGVSPSVPVPSVPERGAQREGERENSDAILELSETRVLVILNLTHSCIKCDKCTPSVVHLSSLHPVHFLVIGRFLQIHLPTAAPPASDTAFQDGWL